MRKNEAVGNQHKLFVAGMGIVTPVGGNTALTAAAVKAGISAYSASRFMNESRQPIVMASVPLDLFLKMETQIDYGDSAGSTQLERVVKMAIMAITEACDRQPIHQAIPLLLAMPEAAAQTDFIRPAILSKNLENHCHSWIDARLSRSFHSGRAAGFEALDFAFRYLYGTDNDYLLIGGSDSYRSYSRLDPLDVQNRLLAAGIPDGFAPGEGAGFILLTPHQDKAMVHDNQLVALGLPALTEEPGHCYSDKPYLGEALGETFKLIIPETLPCSSISRIYSSMNGERYWAKEYGVALLRNHDAFVDDVVVEHPADSYGDLGSATAAVLIGLAAQTLWQRKSDDKYLVYSSSDHGLRGAVLLEKIRLS